MLTYLIFTHLFVLQFQSIFLSGLETCNRTELNYDLIIGLDVKIKLQDIESLKQHLKEQFIEYMKDEYSNYYAEIGKSFEIISCTNDRLEVPSKVINLNLRIEKDGLSETQNAFYDTILLEMISINQLEYRKENDFDYKIRELWNKSNEPESYKLPIWIIIILVFSSTIALATLLLILRQVFECSVDDKKVIIMDYNEGKINDAFVATDDPPMANNVSLSKASLIIPKDSIVAAKDMSNESKSTSNSIVIQKRYKHRKDIKGLEDNYENIRVESANNGQFTEMQVLGTKTNA